MPVTRATRAPRRGPCRPELGEAAACAPEQAWRDLAPAIAGRPRVRVSRNGRDYPARCERDLTDELPAAPAAVMLFDADGAARCLAADFDVARGGRAQVDADAAAFAELVHSCGGATFADTSPSGGRHVYVLWSAPVPVTELGPVLHALRALYPSLDTTPMTNPAAGCVRPPGARHRSGGHQVLTVALEDALAAVRAPCGPEVWAALHDRLAPQLAAVAGGAAASSGADGYVPRPGGPGALSPALERVAQTGLYDLERYASPSEARQAVITAAAAAGWQLPDVAGRLERGTWPGLAGMYARYRPGARRGALGRDWRKAVAHVERGKNARRSTTRGIPHTGEGPTAHRSRRSPADLVEAYRWLRSWWNAVLATERLRYTGPGGASKRLLLRAVGAMAQRRGTRYLDVGRRSLALACGLDDSTVSELLRALRDEDDPWLVLIEDERGVHGDLYELRIPEAAREVARWRRWRAGRIEAVHPCFRALGASRALLYEALTTEPAPRRHLARDAALPARTVDEALATLAEHGLAERVPGQGWRRGPAQLDRLAVELGVDERVQALVVEYCAERAAWRALLGAVGSLLVRDVVYAGAGAPIWWPDELDEPPDAGDPGEMEAALRLLVCELGAVGLDGAGDFTDPRYGIYGAPQAPSNGTRHPRDAPYLRSSVTP